MCCKLEAFLLSSVVEEVTVNKKDDYCLREKKGHYMRELITTQKE
jgi:hypothetical protein